MFGLMLFQILSRQISSTPLDSGFSRLEGSRGDQAELKATKVRAGEMGMGGALGDLPQPPFQPELSDLPSHVTGSQAPTHRAHKKDRGPQEGEAVAGKRHRACLRKVRGPL